MLGMIAWGIELCYLTPLEFVYLYICFKRRSGKRAVMDSYTGSALRFQVLFVGLFFFSPEILFSFLTVLDFSFASLSGLGSYVALSSTVLFLTSSMIMVRKRSGRLACRLQIER